MSSIDATQWAWNLDIKATPKLTLLALSNYVNEEFICYPSLTTIAKMTGQNRRSTIRQINALQASGHLKRVERGNSHGKANLYQLSVEVVTECHHPSDKLSHQGIYISNTKVGVTECHHPSDKESPPALPEGFEEFWKAYPRKVAKPAAVRAFKAVKAEKHLQAIVVNLKTRYIATEKKFIPNPSTYLNQRRWEDELDDVPTDV
ncbi:MAG: helix-turn-helix domain-containing protein, partial [Gammaproteobacteria bacterium]|nr:helix-turn-helix domain-containing protein [Gammaproteobacteria bacterium]